MVSFRELQIFTVDQNCDQLCQLWLANILNLDTKEHAHTLNKGVHLVTIILVFTRDRTGHMGTSRDFQWAISHIHTKNV